MEILTTINEYQFADSVALNCQAEMVAINQYLFDSANITYFGYIKCFTDGTHICLTTDCKWIEYFYKHMFPYGVFHKSYESYTSGIMLWSFANDQTSFNTFREYSSIDHGITLIEKHSDSCEFFTFGGNPDNYQLVNFYLNNLDFLWRHSFYFKDQAEDLIKKANKDRLILPRCEIAKPEEKIVVDNLSLKTILKTTPIQRYHIKINELETYLTNSEAKCCYHLVKGKSIKEIAKNINLSPRTVEHHINNVKDKLLCMNKSDLIIKIANHTNLTKICLD